MNCWLGFALLGQNLSLPHKLTAEGHFNMIFLSLFFFDYVLLKPVTYCGKKSVLRRSCEECLKHNTPHQESVTVRFIHHLMIVLADGVTLSCFVQNAQIIAA